MERELLDAGPRGRRSTPSSMAYRIRFVMQMTAREAMHLTELRSQPAGHPVYRRVAQAMHRLIDEQAGHHAIAGAFTLHELRRRRPRAPGGRTPDGAEAEGAANTRRLMDGDPAVGDAEAGALEAVVRAGAIERAEVRGLADVRTGRPLAADSIFYVGSIAKQFVAACVAMLDHDGDLDLGDPVSRFVPGLPGWGDRVTVRHLVHHTGGVKERTRGRTGVPVEGVPAWGNPELLGALRSVRAARLRAGVIATATRTAATCCSRRWSRRRAAPRSRRSPPSGSSSRSG